YFAKFLSLMEVRSRGDEAWIELSPDSKLLLPPNLYVIGTVNVDETTHGFADKVYDRAQLIEIEFDRNDLYNHIDKGQYRNVIMDVWDAIHSVAPFAFRVVDEMVAYIKESEKLGYSWMESLDDQILQKVLPKIKGTDFAVGEALKALLEVLDPEFFPLCYKKANKMYEGYRNYGITSYF
ncbi:MAG: ATPase associated with various cellular 5, partial [Paenibacillus sp.]|nr:ATPase associated with various cellular 5 [Paenibacillus sp.]